jgi:hypothetical protein
MVTPPFLQVTNRTDCVKLRRIVLDVDCAFIIIIDIPEWPTKVAIKLQIQFD